jgi:HK97 family phage portal protein
VGLLDRVERRTSLESPSVSLSNPPAWLLDSFGAQPTSSGVYVSEQSALRYMPVWLCQRILGETVGALPLKVHKRLARGRTTEHEHWLARLIADPHPDLTTFQFLELLVSHLAIWGNSYWEIETMGGGLRPKALHPLLPNLTKAKRRETGDREKYFVTRIKESGAWRDVELPAERVLHIPGLGYDGLMGYSPISMARQAIGLGLAAEQFGAAFYPNGSHIGLVLTHPQTLSPTARENLRLSLEMMHQGLEQAHRAGVFEEGVKVEKLGVNPEDAQYMELRKFQVVDVARCFRMPLHKLLDYEHATFSNVEHLGIEFATDTIAPITVRVQQAIGKGLLSEEERRTMYCEFVMAGLLRGDVQSRAEANSIAVQNGWKTRNQVREEDNENPIPAEEGGDEYTVQLNMIPLRLLGKELEGDEGDDGPARPEPEPETKAAAGAREERLRILLDRIERSFLPLLESEARRVVTRQAGALRKAITRPEPDLLVWARDFYARDAAYVSQVVGPAARSLMEQVVGQVADLLLPGDTARAAALAERLEPLAAGEVLDFGERTAGAAVTAIEALPGDPVAAGAALSGLLEEWERSRPAVLARDLARAARACGVTLVCDSLGLPALPQALTKEIVC